MGTPAAERQSPGERPLVAFDFDGTLTVKDSFTAFLAWKAGRIGYALGLLSLSHELLIYLVRRDRGRLKAKAAAVFLAGLSPAQVTELAESFAEARAQRLFRPDALMAWNQWRDQGAELVIVSASPGIMLEPFARRLRADRLIATKLAVDGQGLVTAQLDGVNCRGLEKVERLKAIYGPDVRLDAAYGDTSGDHEMLQLAKVRGYRVFKGKP